MPQDAGTRYRQEAVDEMQIRVAQAGCADPDKHFVTTGCIKVHGIHCHAVQARPVEDGGTRQNPAVHQCSGRRTGRSRTGRSRIGCLDF